MRVESLYVCNFRNLSPQTVTPGPLLNEFVGENAHGKTAFLEAINIFILGGSFRTYQLRDTLTFGKNESLLSASVVADGVRTDLSFQYTAEGRSVSINGLRQSSSASLLGILLGVSCGLQDNELIYGPPSSRRRYLDQQIAQIDPFYVEQLRRYTRALMQRNCLLKTRDLRSIKAFEEQLARSGAYLIQQRRATAESLNALVVPFYQTLFGSSLSQCIMIRYQNQCPIDDLFSWHMDQYEKRREKEMRMAATLVGPHRDDVEILLDDRLMKISGSFAQVRAMSLSLRLSEWSLLKKRSGQTPIFLIDDITNAFDVLRTKRLLEICSTFGQVFVSNCDPVDSGSKKFEMVRGVATCLE